MRSAIRTVGKRWVISSVTAPGWHFAASAYRAKTALPDGASSAAVGDRGRGRLRQAQLQAGGLGGLLSGGVDACGGVAAYQQRGQHGRSEQQRKQRMHGGEQRHAQPDPHGVLGHQGERPHREVQVPALPQSIQCDHIGVLHPGRRPGTVGPVNPV